MKRLEEIRMERAVYEETLDEVLLRQGFYNNQIVRLKDEDYIAMLAREYLRSLPNEIVFRVIGDEIETVDENLPQAIDEDSSSVTEEYSSVIE